MQNNRFKNFFVSVIDLIDFVALITLFIVYHVVKLINRRFGKKKSTTSISNGWYTKLVAKLDKARAGSISRIDLIELSMKNMADKRTRTWITMGGMAIGIGLIVLLVSIGYGLEQLVISRVARLEELKQADVIPGLSQDLMLTDKSVSMFKQIPGVVDATPVISAVGKVNYNNSETDMAVYGVTSKYLADSAIKPSYGTVYDSNELATDTSTPQDKTDSVSSDIAADKPVTFTLEEGSWYRVRAKADPKSSIIGYTRLIDKDSKGTEVEGVEYTNGDSKSTRWITAEVPLWEKKDCTGQDGCEDNQFLPLTESGAQVKKTGFIAEINVQVTSLSSNKTDTGETRVLGVQNDGSLPVVEIATLSGRTQETDVTTVPVGGRSNKELIINQSALKVLNIDPAKAVGMNVKITFVIVGSSGEKAINKTQSMETEYKIVGVVPDETTPIVYVPFIDLRSLGVSTYSQVKVIAKDKDTLPKVRAAIESTGFGTLSVVDTIGQIDKLFTSLRTFLAALGIVALTVAALGMFNTLTVSLLERTHEVGLMKAIGMKSSEVKELFMTESMIMGFFGGVLGLLVGIVAGFVLSVVLTLLAITKGVGFLNITYVPLPFALLIIFVSLLVGVGTGYVPARRATRISALDALRYE
jgi:ABC-type antimicrobial peptide transport system permease subunit